MFIPRKDILKEGDRVRLTRDVTVACGTFTKGHELKCIGRGDRGYSFQDDQRNQLLETGSIGTGFYEKIEGL